MSATIIPFPSTATDIKEVVEILWPTGYQKHLEQRQAFYRDRVLGRFFAGERDINKALKEIYE